MSPEEALREVMKDEIFYSTSEGGVTLSGGEPLYSFDFTLELLRLCKEKGLHTAIETSGSAPTEKILEVAKFVDLFLFDCKESDPERHREFVGADNALILKNLKAISDAGKEIILRCPIIPGYNDREDHFLAIAALSEKLPSVSAVEIEPYHPLGESKANKLGREYPLSGKPFAEKSDSEKWIKFISEKTKKPVRLG
jgi:pyruvate formate lyase activating enzyme